MASDRIWDYTRSREELLTTTTTEKKNVKEMIRSVALRADVWEGREPSFNYIIRTFHHLDNNKLLKRFNLEFFFSNSWYPAKNQPLPYHTNLPCRDCFAFCLGRGFDPWSERIGLKDLALLHLWLGFSPWPGNFHMLWIQPVKGVGKSRLAEFLVSCHQGE